MGEVRGQDLPRHFGDPRGEYEAAVKGCGLALPEQSTLLHVQGRAPGEMIQGIITNSVPPPLELREPEVMAGRAAYACILTPKGRMVTDCWVGWRGSTPESGLLVEVSAPGAPATLQHLRAFLPPRLATFQDISPEYGVLLLLGPEAPRVLAQFGLGLRVGSEEVEGMEEGDVLAVGSHPSRGIRVRRVGTFGVPAWEVMADRPTLRGLWSLLKGGGATPVGEGVLETLRVEAGRPVFGQDMDEAIIPVEAGVHERAVDYHKGCYTGQEVIVRIRDRGHVNRHLRGLRFGEGPAVAPGTTLHRPGEDRSVGTVTSEALSPRAGQGIGLGYVRREVEPPSTLRLGSGEGPEVEVLELSGPNWALS